MSDSQLLGVHEAAEALGLSRQALRHRRRRPDFPAPVAELAASPVWTREAIVAYAKSRTERLHERPGVEALAAEADDVLTVDEAAQMIGVSPGVLRRVADQHVGMPGRWHARTGELVGIARSDLGLYARAAGQKAAEHAA